MKVIGGDQRLKEIDEESYDPTKFVENFWFPPNGFRRGSLVETLSDLGVDTQRGKGNLIMVTDRSILEALLNHKETK